MLNDSVLPHPRSHSHRRCSICVLVVNFRERELLLVELPFVPAGFCIHLAVEGFLLVGEQNQFGLCRNERSFDQDTPLPEAAERMDKFIAMTPGSYVLDTNTWNAYNTWGGRSLYTGGSTVSFDRPFARGMLSRPPVDRDDRKSRPVRRGEDPDADGLIFQDYRTSNAYPSAIEYRFSGTTGIEIKNNLTNRRISKIDGATGSVSGNILTARESWFAGASEGNLHLKNGSIGAIDKGEPLSGLTDDFDNDSRPQGRGIDVGADEFSDKSDFPPSK